ncbi:tldc domain-containing protein [Stylonychia lemnae]|uniref:Tldc domain-containing protein n=1 Tax=Stylonychia lemnae TaxID=5949 RepID=A0A078AVU9_STYLE|nr:tldc domain-containing protein [Stylonychia lemnae]|eukprot:CDW84898.1 tldc domain-containing protein [Stylonychia lemnae]
MLICGKCNRFFNTGERKPLNLPCGDVICSVCFNFEISQVQTEVSNCPFDDKHLFTKNMNVVESMFLIRHLKEFDFYNIYCHEHQSEQAKKICIEEDQMVCNSCLIQDPHRGHLEKDSIHLDIKKEYIRESMEKMIPILKQEILRIEKIIDEYQQYLNNERSFTSLQITKDQQIKSSCRKIRVFFFQDLAQDPSSQFCYLKVPEMNIRQISFISFVMVKRKLFHLFQVSMGKRLEVIQAQSGISILEVTKQTIRAQYNILQQFELLRNFLFNLNKRSICPLYQNHQYATYNYPSYMMTFGSNHDLFIASDCNVSTSSSSNLGSDYKVPDGGHSTTTYLAGSQSFRVIEIEVYQISQN